MVQKAETSFDWVMYADATYAGLSALIPIIGVDWLFEQYFKRRIPSAIAKGRDQSLPLIVQYELNKNYNRAGCVKSCLLLPVLTGFWLLKKFSKKILYFLSVKEAADNVNYYWHQAFLIDYALVAGHLETPESAKKVRITIDNIIDQSVSSPLYPLAGQVVENVPHVLRTFFKVLRGKNSDVANQTQQAMSSKWAEFATYLQTIVQKYEEGYQTIELEQPKDQQKEES
jgi:hypothetical protein